jgi:hypothetical protein
MLMRSDKLNILAELLYMAYPAALLAFSLRPAMGRQLAAAGGAVEEARRQEEIGEYDDEYRRQKREPRPEA